MRLLAIFAFAPLLAAGQLFDFPKAPAARSASASLALPVIQARLVDVHPDELRLTLDGTVRFPLLDGHQYQARLARFESRASDDYTWHGKLDTTPPRDVLFTVKNGRVAALIYGPNGTYQMLPTPDGTLLAEIDPNGFGPCVVSTQTPVAPAPEPPDSPHDAPPVIDIFVSYTPAARDEAGGIEGINLAAQQAVDTTNMAYANSGLPHRLRLLGTAEISLTPGTASTAAYLPAFAASEPVAALREEQKADLMALLIAKSETQADGSCGTAYLLRNANQNSGAAGFSVISLPCAVANLSFAHETGHNFGAEHDPRNGSLPTEAYAPFAYGHFVDGQFRSVMSYSTECRNGCPRIPFYSTPAQTFGDTTLGIAEQRDNVRLFLLTAPIVARFR